ncbi:2-amino-4-hydroxy-6-hydroxymethyldihydropteridine diphosphokinase [Rhodovulum adriaticum]|nr:2-amino-4-hydroxy-6-hydroxymethyldihydropteridine diphosphokinase [Rhodovulum adriaticum]MBK1634942.1 2-amino-4-hydroxy-6-hydroxymethyldihydropteridine diphosphokinase [Rhodovulum adriaticum]
MQRRNLHKTYTKGLIALGANVASPAGSPAETLAAALSGLDGEGMRITAVSRFYRTPCMPAGAGPDFVNAVAAIETTLPPAAVLARLHEVEAAFGRTRTVRWAARTLDLDLLDLGGTVLPDADTQTAWRTLPPEAQAQHAPPALILPHPRLQDRAFVLVPLAEVAPDWQHPILGMTAQQMLQVLPDSEKAPILPIFGPWADLSALVKAFDSQ